DEGAGLSDTFHTSIWPGETGLSGVTGVDQQIYWGVASPTPSIFYGGGVRAIGEAIGRALS
ncbi:hypothetical protein PYV61_26290, partial [Roseisolibacter sp. H3M3-2]